MKCAIYAFEAVVKVEIEIASQPTIILWHWVHSFLFNPVSRTPIWMEDTMNFLFTNF